MILKGAISLAVLYLAIGCRGMENGLARTPPMGWLAWERFRCNTDCKNHPDTCLSEKLFMDMADMMVRDGWKDLGYVQINIDDCWMYHQRDAQGHLIPDPSRFPSGMKFLADYIHARGLKLGIYADNGNHTCSGYPGSLGHEKVDAQTFANWGIDMLKYDGCESTDAQKQTGYPKMSHELNATGRPIIFSCSWPAEAGHVPPKINFTLLAEICNLWRNYNDISDSFNDVMTIINWFAKNQDVLIPAAGPGHWNDPDMLIGGDFSLSNDQAKLQFGMWAMLAAPLLLSADLRSIDPEKLEILQNKQIIKIDQDPIGIPGRRVKVSGFYQLWVRPLLGSEQAIAVLNTANSGGASDFRFSMSILGIENPAAKYEYFNIFDSILKTTIVGLNDTITVQVNPQGITILRATPLEIPTKVEEKATKVEEKEVFIFDVL